MRTGAGSTTASRVPPPGPAVHADRAADQATRSRMPRRPKPSVPGAKPRPSSVTTRCAAESDHSGRSTVARVALACRRTLVTPLLGGPVERHQGRRVVPALVALPVHRDREPPVVGLAGPARPARSARRNGGVSSLQGAAPTGVRPRAPAGPTAGRWPPPRRRRPRRGRGTSSPSPAAAAIAVRWWPEAVVDVAGQPVALGGGRQLGDPGRRRPQDARWPLQLGAGQPLVARDRGHGDGQDQPEGEHQQVRHVLGRAVPLRHGATGTRPRRSATHPTPTAMLTARPKAKYAVNGSSRNSTRDMPDPSPAAMSTNSTKRAASRPAAGHRGGAGPGTTAARPGRAAAAAEQAAHEQQRPGLAQAGQPGVPAGEQHAAVEHGGDPRDRRRHACRLRRPRRAAGTADRHVPNGTVRRRHVQALLGRQGRSVRSRHDLPRTARTPSAVCWPPCASRCRAPSRRSPARPSRRAS